MNTITAEITITTPVASAVRTQTNARRGAAASVEAANGIALIAEVTTAIDEFIRSAARQARITEERRERIQTATRAYTETRAFNTSFSYDSFREPAAA